MRFDDAGRLWAAADDSLHCLDQNGVLIGKVLIPEVCSNVCFGGPKRNYLFICATTSLYGVLLSIQPREDVIKRGLHDSSVPWSVGTSDAQSSARAISDRKAVNALDNSLAQHRRSPGLRSNAVWTTR
jgi:hypothetical protein